MLTKTKEKKLKHLLTMPNTKERLLIWQKTKGMLKDKKVKKHLKTLRQEWKRNISIN
ncbi:hypothetical protein ACFL23_01520 [Patescibacteria group bacterium]